MGSFGVRGTLRHCVIAGWAGWLFAAVASAQQSVVPAESSEAASGIRQTPVDLGIVIRVSERLFQMHPKTVSRTTPVRESIVGVCNVGTAHVTGNLNLDLRPKTDGMAMDLIFRGTSTSRTVARQNAARIFTSSTMDVEVTTPITLDLESGFQLGTSTSRAALTGTCRCVDAELPGLRGLIVRKVANRRIREQESQIRRDSEQATLRRTETGARSEVEQRLQDWNAQWDPLRQLLIAQSMLKEDRDVQFASDEQHLIFYIQPRAMPSANHSADSPSLLFPPAMLPDPRANGLVDLIFYIPESQKPAMTGVLALMESVIDDYAADQPIADRLSVATSDGPGWSMLSVSTDSKHRESTE